MTEALARLRDDLHTRAYDFHVRGRWEVAQTLWAVVDALDNILTDPNGDRHGRSVDQGS